MASPLPPTATILCPNSTSLTSIPSFTPSLFPKKSQKPSLLTKPSLGFVCKAENNGNDQNHDIMGKFDRRNMLIGLGAGGLYGAAGLETNPFAFATPVPAPDLSTCVPSTVGKEIKKTIDCCPPKTSIIDFKLPENPKLRTRLAAQNVANNPEYSEYLAKFKKGIQLMRELPHDDPRSLAQQAMVHCAYCDDAYPMAGFPNVKIQVHGGWLFFPFHRWYLYFFEKILAKLISDPTFALPFWNWDAPDGMHFPSIFTTCPLNDENRNALHMPPALVDLNYDKCSGRAPSIEENLITMYRQMDASSNIIFFGQPYSAGDSPKPGAGNIENTPHNDIHDWTGDPTQINGEDMGILYSAARDPVFYAHHSNVDRMWSIYKSKLGGKDISCNDYLDAEFLFYDENKNLVRVKVRDSLDELKLGYKYEDVPIPWLHSKPTARKSKNKRKANFSSADLASKFPLTLTDTISVEVSRPSAVKRTAEEKKAEEEVLVITGIEFNGSEKVKFDVYVNDDADTVSGKDKTEFAGSFVHVPILTESKIKTNLWLGMTTQLADLGAEEDSSVVVTLVPRSGKEPIIGGLKIDLIPTTI